MLEPAVTLSDFALTVECLIFAALLRRHRAKDRQGVFALLFLTIAAAAFIGALVHGWFPTPGTPTHDVLWPASMLAVGASGALLWLISIALMDEGRLDESQLDEGRPLKRAKLVLSALFVGYALIVLFINQRFYVALAAYLPAAVFLGALFLKRYLADRSTADRWGLIGIGLTLVAGAVQYFGIAIHPRYFDHNAFYHAIEAVGLLALFLAAKSLSNPR